MYSRSLVARPGERKRYLSTSVDSFAQTFPENLTLFNRLSYDGPVSPIVAVLAENELSPFSPKTMRAAVESSQV
jgi:hypothetical protein